MQRRTAIKALVTMPMAGFAAPASAASGERLTKTMLEMTFPEFEDAVRLSDIALVPVGAVEAHGAHLPLNADALGAIDQLGEVQLFLARRGVRSLIGPSLNIGITNEAGDQRRDGTYIYPGSLTVGVATFVELYVDLLRSLRVNGLKRIFLYSHHLGGRHLTAMADAAVKASAEVDDLKAYALIDSERLARLDVNAGPEIVSVVEGLNFKMLAGLLGGTDAFTTHADGWETSLMLHYRPAVVRDGYQTLPQSPSPPFLAAGEAGDRRLNPGGIGGFPTSTATAEVGRKIAAYRSERIGQAVLNTLGKT